MGPLATCARYEATATHSVVSDIASQGDGGAFWEGALEKHFVTQRHFVWYHGSHAVSWREERWRLRLCSLRFQQTVKDEPSANAGSERESLCIKKKMIMCSNKVISTELLHFQSFENILLLSQFYSLFVFLTPPRIQTSPFSFVLFSSPYL